MAFPSGAWERENGTGASGLVIRGHKNILTSPSSAPLAKGGDWEGRIGDRGAHGLRRADPVPPQADIEIQVIAVKRAGASADFWQRLAIGAQT